MAAMIAASLLVPSCAQAEPVEAFFQGKTINMIIGYPAGGSNDLYARAVSRHIGKHLPGNPTVLPRNMPGAGSMIAANHLFNVAPRDGTALGLIAATIPLEEVLGAANVKFKSTEFNWIGRVAGGVNLAFVMKSSPIKSIKDAFEREVIMGASGRSSTVAIYPAVLANVLGVKFKMVMGYTGSTSAMLAMERGEIDGHCTSMENIRTSHPDWLSEWKITPLVQFALKRHHELSDVPMSWELGRNAEEQQILKIVASATEIGKMILTPPDIPADRVFALRRAFDATVKDPNFIAELKTMRIELGPMPGEELQKMVEDVGSVSPDILDKVRAMYPLN